MKKIILIAAGLLTLLLAILITLPVIFKDKINQLVKEEANRSLNATLDFDDAGLSFFKQFPRATLSVEGLRIINKAPFDGDTLAAFKDLQITVSLSSLFGDGPLTVNRVRLVNPLFNLKTLPDGRANWEVFQPTETSETSETAPSASASLELQHYEIVDAALSFDDRAGNQNFSIGRLNHRGSGDFSAARFMLETVTDVHSIDFRSGGQSFLTNATLDAEINLDVDAETQKISFRKNTLRLNQLALSLDGWMAQKGDSTAMALTFNAPQARFKDILSMIPAIYQSDFQSLQADGKFEFSGNVNGTAAGNKLPAFNFILKVADGRFQYADLPTPVKDIAIDMTIMNPGKTADHTVVDVRNFHMATLGEAIDARLLLKTPESDPYIDAMVKGKLDLDQFKKTFPMETGVDISGKILSDLSIKGQVSAISRGIKNRFSARGSFAVSDFAYTAPDLPENIRIKAAKLNFDDHRATLENLNLQSGKSDLQARGLLENIFGYLFDSQTLKGTLTVSSGLFDLNPWMEGETEPLVAIELPDQIEFLMSVNITRAIYTNLTMNNVSGSMLLRDRKLDLIDLRANSLGGALTANGSYQFIPPAKPNIFFDFKLSDISIPETYKSFLTMRQFMPLAERLSGSFSGELNLQSDLDNNLMPLWQQFFSRGSLTLPKVKIDNATVLNKIAEVTKINQFHNPAINNLNPVYVIKGGRFHLNPLTFNIGNYQIVASGSNGIDQSLDYSMKIHLPAAELKQNANAVISQLIKKDVNMMTNETIVLDVSVKGTNKEPQVKTSLSDIVAGATNPLADAAKLEAEKRKAELERKKQEELEKQKAELEKKKKEAEQKLKDKLKGLFKKN